MRTRLKRLCLRPNAGLSTIAVGIAALAIVPFALASAINTTDDSGQTVNAKTTGPCLHGPSPAVNCNLYGQKEDVFLSGSPSKDVAGTYFFAVLSPGGQADPNDGSANNLSSPIDTAVDREFSVDSSGTISNLGSHFLDIPNNRLSAWEFNDTSNPGGVYIMSVCKISSAENTSAITVPTVDPKDCKYDAFKVRQQTPCETDCGGGGNPNADLDVFKTVVPTFTRDYDWAVGKSQDTSNTPINGSGSTVNVHYTVTATWSGPTDSGWDVSGVITVSNPNAVDFTGVEVSDQIVHGASDDPDPNANCVVSDAVGPIDHTNATIPANGSVDFPYDCDFSGGDPADTSAETNIATATWNATTNDTTDDSAQWPVPFTWGTDPDNGNPTVTHDTTTVSDNFNGGGAQALGVANVDGTWAKDNNNHLTGFAEAYSSPLQKFTLTYTRAVTVVPNTCATYDNTATVSPDADTTNDSADASVTVCGRITGGLTIGFWSNKNGKAVLCAHDPTWRNQLDGTAATAPYNAGSYLRNANGTFYTVPTTGSCANAQSNYASWLLNATATNMSYMLSAQLSGTINNVAFNGMIGTACIAGPSGTTSINSLIASAIGFLQAHGNTTASGALRDQATALKNIFDGLNNGNVFAVPGPCV